MAAAPNGAVDEGELNGSGSLCKQAAHSLSSQKPKSRNWLQMIGVILGEHGAAKHVTSLKAVTNGRKVLCLLSPPSLRNNHHCLAIQRRVARVEKW